MIDSFSTALGTALTTFVSDVSGAIGDNTAVAVGFALSVAGIFVVWRIVARMIHARS